MSNKTVLVTGATGLLGRQVVKAFAFHGWTVKGTGFSRADGKNILKVDLSNAEEIEKVIEDVKPQVVVHYVAVKYLQTDDKAALPRVLQFSSEDRYTKYEMCQLFGEIMGLPIDRVEPNTEGNDPNASVQRPYDCHLSTRALKELGVDVSTQDFVGWWRRECRAFRH
ncbi:hypothetical protein N0V88_001386 [Collariella sp. IMI 366227]|nr:hypothetical protein N0V88_001386 [Collariella sp. IMI 366227]